MSRVSTQALHPAATLQTVCLSQQVLLRGPLAEEAQPCRWQQLTLLGVTWCLVCMLFHTQPLVWSPRPMVTVWMSLSTYRGHIRHVNPLPVHACIRYTHMVAQSRERCAGMLVLACSGVWHLLGSLRARTAYSQHSPIQAAPALQANLRHGWQVVGCCKVHKGASL